MALIRCYECGKEISSLATACPSCGAPPQSTIVPPPLPTEARPASRTKQLSCGTIALLTGVVLVLVIRGVTRQPNTPSPSPGPLTLTESSVETMTQTPAFRPSLVGQTPASGPSLVDQLLREGIELREIRGDTTNAIERLQEALDSEPNNAAVLSELAKTYDLMQLYDRANEIWRKLQEMGPSAGVAYELADRRLKPVLTRSSVA